MNWKWYEITDYKASVGSNKDNYYGSVQLFGKDFYGVLYFHKSGTLPGATTPFRTRQRFYGHLDFQQMPVIVDLLRNEKPVRFGWFTGDPNKFHLMTGKEAVGEGDGILADISEVVAN